ncbi:hypothetical protein AXG93_4193s1090 [Marchantia polymorpha subsp. ruderalis]|uniref:WWE domain-containing protein n=1 Tax=Marchantia polymorpha subsp. ruderalis TaxID=1480154 RepID=A0A176W3X1_MARPO|nr:hypothetical protein AXG93_4193s1090 [Marchantia polymorpha subsp. ruderalis]
MCILQPCADPQEEGVWWRDDTSWKKYESALQSQIRNGVSSGLKAIDLGTIKSSVHPNGARYTVNLQKMEQVAVSSGQIRPIKIIDRQAVQAVVKKTPPQLTMAPPPPPQQRNPAIVHYKDSSGVLKQYDQDIATALLRAIVSSQRSLLITSSRTGKNFYFDIPNMTQCFIDEDGSELDELPVQVVIEVLSLTLEQYRSNHYLDATLPVQASPRKIISKDLNLDIKPGHPLYEGFLDVLHFTVLAVPEAIESFISRAAATPSRSGDELPVVRTVFKPAPRKVSKSSDPSSKEVSTFWCDMAAPLAAAHALVYGTAVQLRVMAYLIITPPAELKRRKISCQSDVVRINPEHCLSLALLNVSG